jgi:DNA-binding transcriptional ArsR family regulator
VDRRAASDVAAVNRCGNCSSAADLVNDPRWGWTCRDCVRINEGGHVVEGANASPHSVTAPSPVAVPVPVPSIGEEERADLDVLLDTKADAVSLETVELSPRATPAMRRVLDDLAHCSGLLRAAGDDGTVIYAVDWAAKRLGLSSSTVSIALRRLRKFGAIRLVKMLPGVENGRAGARVYEVVPGRPNLQVLEGGQE